jgi:hypothetical protein
VANEPLPREHEDRGCWLARTAYYSRTSQNYPKAKLI